MEAAREGEPEKKPCTNLTRTFQSEAAKQSYSGDNYKVDGCKVHGNCNPKEEAIDLDEQKNFTQFLCFLATLKFKLYHVYETPEVSQSSRQS
jgi:hypothetical protein